MRSLTALAPLFFVLASCASPPKPPAVDESRRHSVNVTSAVELQVCKTGLQNTRILVSETTHLAESASATAAKLALQQRELATRDASEHQTGNLVYIVRFAFGSAIVGLPNEDATTLIERARAAPLILLRARTDGEVEAPSESHIARARAAAVRSYLVKSGIDPSHIRVTWQPMGDTVADNTTAVGRHANRRVEIEIYQHTPQVVVMNGSTS